MRPALRRQARALAREVPAAVVERLWEFEENGSDSGVLVLHGLETGEVPPTPGDNSAGLGGATLLGRQQAVLSHVLGHAVGCAAEAHGHLLQDVVPNRRLATAQQSQGPRVELEAHTEQCFSALRPDHVGADGAGATGRPPRPAASGPLPPALSAGGGGPGRSSPGTPSASPPPPPPARPPSSRGA